MPDSRALDRAVMSYPRALGHNARPRALGADTCTQEPWARMPNLRTLGLDSGPKSLRLGKVARPKRLRSHPSFYSF